MVHTLVVALYTAAALSQAPQTDITQEEQQELTEKARSKGLTDAMVAKMDGAQLRDVLSGEVRKPPAVAMAAVVGFFTASTLTILAVLYAIYRIYRQRTETIRLMVEKGVDIPPELLMPKRQPASDLRRGLVLMMFGLGLGIFLFAVSNVPGLWTLGFVPLLVGAGYFISFGVSREQALASTPPSTAS